MKNTLWTMILTGVIAMSTTGCTQDPPAVRRFGSVIGVKDEKLAYYKELHAKPWPAVLKNITKCNIRNYVIYLRKMDDGKHYLFSHFEYIGDDFEADMKLLAEDKETQRWWKETDPCQFPLKNETSWASMKEVFYLK